jgi:hypothetical protein
MGIPTADAKSQIKSVDISFSPTGFQEYGGYPGYGTTYNNTTPMSKYSVTDSNNNVREIPMEAVQKLGKQMGIDFNGQKQGNAV